MRCKANASRSPCPQFVRSFAIRRSFFACLLVSMFLAGCGGKGGPPRYDISGSVTFGGRSVPRGYIVFTPDGSQGNAGPGAQAEIVDGSYRTPDGQGTIGGPHVAVLTGFDGQSYQDGVVTNPNGKLLFSQQEVRVELPRENSSHDFTLSP